MINARAELLSISRAEWDRQPDLLRDLVLRLDEELVNAMTLLEIERGHAKDRNAF